jgi:hypothetical protein
MLKPCDCNTIPEAVDAASGENILGLVPGVAIIYLCAECQTSWLPHEEELKIDAYLKSLT